MNNNQDRHRKVRDIQRRWISGQTWLRAALQQGRKAMDIFVVARPTVEVVIVSMKHHNIGKWLVNILSIAKASFKSQYQLRMKILPTHPTRNLRLISPRLSHSKILPKRKANKNREFKTKRDLLVALKLARRIVCVVAHKCVNRYILLPQVGKESLL